MKRISKIILEIVGWKLVGEFPDIKKSVVVLAPHTSYWDFIVGKLYLSARGINNHTLMKKEAFFFPLSLILKVLGAIPVDRKNKKSNMVTQVAKRIKQQDELNLFIAPEGTRKRKNYWKKGFYHIAKQAEVPIVMSFIDYKNKEVGIQGVVKNTNTIKDTMTEINNFYKKINPKHIAYFTLDEDTN